jgi:hypothetical protein
MSAKSTVSESKAVWPPLAPLTVKLNEPVGDVGRLVTVRALFWPALIDDGLNVQVELEIFVQVSAMLPVKPLGTDAETVKLVEVVPAVIVAELLVAASEKLATGVPFRDTDCGLPAALSVIVMVPF